MSNCETMVKKSISVPDVKREYLRYVMARYGETSWAERILYELMGHSKNGIVEDPHTASVRIQNELGIDDLMYRQQIHKLKAKKFIKRHGHVLILHPLLALDGPELAEVVITGMPKA